jgi:Spy/CpxP family protein refolding chaperone
MKACTALVSSSCLFMVMATAHAQQTPPTAAQIAEHEVQFYTAVLSLTSEQQTEALEIFTVEATSASTIEASEQTLHNTLESGITSGNSSVISQTASSLGYMDGELTALRATAEAKLYQLLTTEQQARFTALQQAHVGMGGGPGGPGAPPQ